MIADIVPSDVLGAHVEFGDVGVVDTGADAARVASLGRSLAMLTPTDSEVRVFADRSAALIEVPEVGRYLVTNGERILIDPVADPAPTPTVIRTWLHGTVLSMLLGQQGRFALHASVVEIDGVRIAIAGVQRAGKSTTSLAVSLSVGSLVSDDVAVLDPGPMARVRGDGQPPAPSVARPEVRLIPFGRSVHVWVETAGRLGLDIDGAPQVASGFDKVSLSPPDVEAGPIHGVVILRPDESVQSPQLFALGERAALLRIRRHTYRPQLLEKLWPEDLFQWQATVARRLSVAQLLRPVHWSVDEVVETLVGFARTLSE